MLSYFTKFTRINPSDIRASSVISQYVNNTNKGIDRIVDLCMTISPLPSSGIDLLYGLLMIMDHDYIRSFSTDIGRFRAIDKEYSRMIGTAVTHYPFKYDTFVKNSDSSQEIILYVSDIGIISKIPFEMPYETWNQLTPMRVHRYTSKEYSVNVLGTYMKHRLYIPDEVVYTVDLRILMNMFCKYFDTTDIDVEAIYKFIYQTCIVPTIKSAMSGWITHIVYEAILKHRGLSEVNFDDFVSLDRGVFANSRLDVTIHEIRRMIDEVDRGKITPDIFINTIMVSPDKSLVGSMIDARDNTSMSTSAQDTWLAFIRDFTHMQILHHLYELSPITKAKMFRRRMIIVKKRFTRTRFWGHVKDPMMKSIIESQLDMFI